MALVAMTVSDTVDYVSDLDPAKVKATSAVDPNDPSKGEKETVTIADGATVFQVGALDVFLMGYIYDNASSLVGKQGSDEVGIKTRINQTNIDAVRFGLRGFKNFSDRKGDQVRFKGAKAVVNSREYDVVHDNVINMLGVQLIAELATKIKEISEVTAAEEKNSDAA